MVNIVLVFKIPMLVSFNSIGSKFSSQGHFHSLQLLKYPSFCSVGLLGSKLLPEVISAILSRDMALTTPTN